MRKLSYQLVKEDYKSWIHWNVQRHDSKKMKLISAAIYIAFVVLFLGKNAAAARENPAALIPSLIFAAVIGGAMYYTTSSQNQERIIWKRSGLGRLEKENRFPVVEMTIMEKGIVMEVAAENVRNEYSFSDICKILEIERLFLLEVNDKTWQFVAKSAFENQEQMEEFKALIEEKIEDAGEHPECYVSGKASVTEEEKAQNEAPRKQEALQEASSENGEAKEAEIPKKVDTSRMGKIGKMAHIMAAADRDEEKDGGEDGNPMGGET